jgi:PAS domain S-box-containing protein
MPRHINNLQSILVEASTEGFVVADEQGVIQFCNPAASDLFGYDQDEMTGMRVEDLIPREHRGNHAALRSSYHAKPERKPMGKGRNLRALRKDGSSFYVEISLTPLSTEDRSWVCALITDVDLRVKLHLENEALNSRIKDLLETRTLELSQTQQLYQTVARNYPNGMICVLDENLVCLFAEGKYLDELRLSGNDLAGTPYLDHLPDELREGIRQNLERALKGGIQSTEIAHNGHWFQLDAVALDGPNEGQLMVIEQNISEAVAALKKEKELNEWMSRFVSMASHEFRTPLSAISLSADLTQRHLTHGNVARTLPHLEKIQGNVRHLTSILNDFLNLERLESGKIENLDGTFDLADLLQRVVQDGTLSATATHRIHLHIEANAKAHPMVVGNQEAITGIASNLLSNAIKYSPNGGNIVVELSRHAHEWRLVVEDQGVGISPEDSPHIFQRFYRAEATQHIPGTGVGLDLVVRYAHVMGGTVTCQSEIGQGTRMTVVWPHHLETS